MNKFDTSKIKKVIFLTIATIFTLFLSYFFEGNTFNGTYYSYKYVYILIGSFLLFCLLDILKPLKKLSFTQSLVGIIIIFFLYIFLNHFKINNTYYDLKIIYFVIGSFLLINLLKKS